MKTKLTLAKHLLVGKFVRVVNNGGAASQLTTSLLVMLYDNIELWCTETEGFYQVDRHHKSW